MTINVKFDHSAKQMGQVFGISDYEEQYARMAIVFETVSSALLVNEMYNDVSEAPRELKTESGMLERILNHGTSDGMRAYMLVYFRQGYESTMHLLKEATSLQEEISKNAAEPGDLGGAIKNLVLTLKLQSIQHTLDAVKKANFSFDAFIQKIMPNQEAHESNKERMKDIDQMLGGILGSCGEEEDPE